jgi:hypothetical protein
MHDTYGIETYLKYHTEDLIQQAEHERQIQKVARSISRKSTDRSHLHIVIGFTRTPDTRFGRIVIEGGLK